MKWKGRLAIAAVALSTLWLLLVPLLVAAQNRHNAHVACVTRNFQNDQQRALWDRIFKFPSPRHLTAKEQRQAQDLHAYINATFAHTDCDHPTVQPSTSPPPALPAHVAPTVTTTATLSTSGGVRTVVITRLVPGPTKTVVRCVRPSGRPC